MKSILSILCLLCVSFSLNAYDVRHSYEGNYLYEGNPSGKFEADFVAVLEDGSEWKVLERQDGKFTKWKIGETVRIKLRKNKDSDHKHQFRLYNYKRDEAVKVMPLSFGRSPLQVRDCISYPTSTKSVPQYEQYFYYDYDGNLQVEWVLVGYEEVPCNYKTEVSLTDGSRWIIHKGGKYYSLGTHVYVGYNEKRYFLITGKKDWHRVDYNGRGS